MDRGRRGETRRQAAGEAIRSQASEHMRPARQGIGGASEEDRGAGAEIRWQARASASKPGCPPPGARSASQSTAPDSAAARLLQGACAGLRIAPPPRGAGTPHLSRAWLAGPRGQGRWGSPVQPYGTAGRGATFTRGSGRNFVLWFPYCPWIHLGSWFSGRGDPACFGFRSPHSCAPHASQPWPPCKGRFTLAAGRRAARALQQCNWLLFVFSFHTGAAGREHADEKSADVACRWQ